MDYFIIATICTIVSGFLFKKASGTISLHSPNMMSVIFYVYFVLNNVVGAALIVNRLDDHYLINKISDDMCRYYGFWTIIYTLISFPIGQLIANNIFHKREISVLYQKYVFKSIEREPYKIQSHVKNTLLILSVLSLIAVGYTLMTIGGSPLSAALSGTDPMDLALMRADANRNFGGNVYFRNVFGLNLTPFLSYIAYGYKKYHNSRFNRLWFWTLFLASVLILTYDLEKSPLLWYFLGFMFYKVYMGYRLSNKTLFIIFGSLTGFVIVIYLSFPPFRSGLNI